MNRTSIPLNKKDVQEKGSIFVFSEVLGLFDFGRDHPFKPERAIKTYDLCSRYGVMNHPWMVLLDPEPLDAGLLTSFHEPGLPRPFNAHKRAFNTFLMVSKCCARDLIRPPEVDLQRVRDFNLLY